MRQALILFGLMSLIVYGGTFLAFYKKDEASVTVKENSMSLSLTSPAFNDGETIPFQYTCDGQNVSVPLHIEGVPEGTESLVLLMDDPDIPQSVKEARGIEKFDHWALYNIPANTVDIGEDERIGALGLNSLGQASYRGPCPPDREHRYFFRLYAVRGTLNFVTAPTLTDIEGAAAGMMIEHATLMGRYERSTSKK